MVACDNESMLIEISSFVMISGFVAGLIIEHPTDRATIKSKNILLFSWLMSYDFPAKLRKPLKNEIYL